MDTSASTSGRDAPVVAARELDNNFFVANNDDDLRKIITKAAGRLVRCLAAAPLDYFIERPWREQPRLIRFTTRPLFRVNRRPFRLQVVVNFGSAWCVHPPLCPAWRLKGPPAFLLPAQPGAERRAASADERSSPPAVGRRHFCQVQEMRIDVCAVRLPQPRGARAVPGRPSLHRSASRARSRAPSIRAGLTLPCALRSMRRSTRNPFSCPRT